MARPRLRYSLRTLIAEVSEVFPDVKYKTLGENSLGVAHTVAFDHDASHWLEPFAEILAKDERVDFAEMREDGRVWVRVKDSNRLSDNAAEFHLLAAAEIYGVENPEAAYPSLRTQTSDDALDGDTEVEIS